jgi:hypothetical protein
MVDDGLVVSIPVDIHIYLCMNRGQKKKDIVNEVGGAL